MHPDGAVHHQKENSLVSALAYLWKKKVLTHVTDVKFLYTHIYAPCHSRHICTSTRTHIVVCKKNLYAHVVAGQKNYRKTKKMWKQVHTKIERDRKTDRKRAREEREREKRGRERRESARARGRVLCVCERERGRE